MASPTFTKSERTGCYPDVFARVLAYKEAYYADLAAREKKSWDDAQAAKDAFDKQKADELAELIAWQDAERAQRAFDRAERYAQLDAQRDMEIQSLIAEAEDEANAEEQVIPDDRRASIIAALRSYDWPVDQERAAQAQDSERTRGIPHRGLGKARMLAGGSTGD